jgi:cell division protein FtsZ
MQGISDLIMTPGLINLDFADVRAIMSERGNALMGIGRGSGENRAIQAAQQAISSPLLEETSIEGARGVLINITGGVDMALSEVDEAALIVTEKAHKDANIIFGAVTDESIKDEIIITVIATGFGVDFREKKKKEEKTIEFETYKHGKVEPQEEKKKEGLHERKSGRMFQNDVFEIPAFLRRRAD